MRRLVFQSDIGRMFHASTNSDRLTPLIARRVGLLCLVFVLTLTPSLGSLFGATAAAQSPRFSQTCTPLSFGDCVQFQDYWDHATMSRHYDCPFPSAAKQCWNSSAYIIKGCRASPLGLDFIAAHDIFSNLFRKAYASGEFKKAPALMYILVKA